MYSVGLNGFNVPCLAINTDYTNLYAVAYDPITSSFEIFKTNLPDNLDSIISEEGPVIEDENWKMVGDKGFSDMFIDSNNDQILFAPTKDGLQRSMKGGKDWEKLGVSYNILCIDPENPGYVYGCENGGKALYFSDNYGDDWEFLFEFEDQIGSIAIDNLYSNVLYIGLRFYNENFPNGIYKSVDYGKTWEKKTFPDGTYGKGVICRTIAQNPVNNYLYVGAETLNHNVDGWNNSPFYRSIDGGETWEDIKDGMNWHVFCIQFDAINNIVFAKFEGFSPDISGEKYAYFKSYDDGETWEKVKINPKISAASLLINPYNSIQTYMPGCTMDNLGVFQSPDGGYNYNLFGLKGISIASLKANSDFTKIYAYLTDYYCIYMTELPSEIKASQPDIYIKPIKDSFYIDEEIKVNVIASSGSDKVKIKSIKISEDTTGLSQEFIIGSFSYNETISLGKISKSGKYKINALIKNMDSQSAGSSCDVVVKVKPPEVMVYPTKTTYNIGEKIYATIYACSSSNLSSVEISLAPEKAGRPIFHNTYKDINNALFKKKIIAGPVYKQGKYYLILKATDIYGNSNSYSCLIVIKHVKD